MSQPGANPSDRRHKLGVPALGLLVLGLLAVLAGCGPAARGPMQQGMAEPGRFDQNADYFAGGDPGFPHGDSATGE